MNLQYRVRDPYVYHYRTEDPERVITDSVRDEVRAFVGAGDLNHLLNVRREELEAEIHRLFAGSGGRADAGIAGGRSDQGESRGHPADR